jgi:hypothetical protein
LNGLETRAAAARELVRAGELSPSTALFLTCFPTEEVEQASTAPHARQHFTKQQRAHALELVAAGWSWSIAAEATGCSKGLIGDWLRADRRARGPAAGVNSRGRGACPAQPALDDTVDLSAAAA